MLGKKMIFLFLRRIPLLENEISWEKIEKCDGGLKCKGLSCEYFPKSSLTISTLQSSLVFAGSKISVVMIHECLSEIMLESDYARTYSTMLRPMKIVANILSRFLIIILGNLNKHDGDGWRERHKTKGLISKTMTLHVRYRFLYISLPSSAKQQREMIKFKVLGRTWTHDSEFSLFYLNCNAVLTESAPGLFGYIRQIERVETIAKKFQIFGSHF